jgi:predicted hydrolase (HD superfamily)
LSWRKVTFSHLPPEKVTGTLHDLDSKVADVERSGVCGGDPLESDNFKEVVLRVLPGDCAKRYAGLPTIRLPRVRE